MRIIREWIHRFRDTLRPRRADADLQEELRVHLELAAAAAHRRGPPEEDHAREALMRAGGMTPAMDALRDQRGLPWLDALGSDLVLAWRLLRRDWVVAVTAVLSLAIGIGANTAVASIARTLLGAPAGVDEPGRLVDISRVEPGGPSFAVSYPYYLDVLSRTTTLSGLYAFDYEPRAVSLGTGTTTESAFVQLVTGNYFAVLGVTPAAGRLLVESDDRTGDTNPVAVLSHRFWMRRFGGDRSMVGQQVIINRHAVTIVGVARDGFSGTNLIVGDLWMPLGMAEVVQSGSRRLGERRMRGMGMGGRLRTGVFVGEAQAELDAIAAAIEREHPVIDRATRLRVGPLSSIPGSLTTVAASFIALLLVLVLIVLVIACTNLAGVLLARAVARRREIALRMAVGAGRARVVRQLLTETMLLFVIGGATGMLLARGFTMALLAVLPAFPVPVEMSLPLDVPVLAFAIALTLVAAGLCGIAPALHVSKTDVVSGLKDGSQGPAERLRLRHAFVVVQIACSIVLVIAAGLFVRALDHVNSASQGFEDRGIEMATLDLTTAGYSDTAGQMFARELLERLRQLPGLETATLSRYLPGRGGLNTHVTVPGVTPPDGQAHFTLLSNSVGSDYFSTLRIPLMAGREFTAADGATAPRVVILTELVARMFWPNDDAIGQYLFVRDAADAMTPVQVVGVTRDLEDRVVRKEDGRTVRFESVRLMMYVPLEQQFSPQFTILIRPTPGRRTAGVIQDVVRSLNANLAVQAQPLAQQYGPAHWQLRVAASVAGSVGLVGLLLAVIGVYGVTAYTTARRTREIGVRIAMGARRPQIVGLILRQGVLLVGVGAIAGFAIAAATSGLLSRFLFGLPPFDLAVFGSAALLFGVTCLVASYLPAHRAGRIEPTHALRHD